MTQNVQLSVPVPKSVVDVLQALYNVVDGIVTKQGPAALLIKEVEILVTEYNELKNLPADVQTQTQESEYAGEIYATACVNRLMGKTVVLPTISS